MIHLARRALIPMCFGVVVLTGCSGSSSSPAEIKGMSPAEYRESHERVIEKGPGGKAKAVAKTVGGSR